jgi:OOP family OmpA-OmpF porin
MSRITWVLAGALSLISLPAMADENAGFYAGVGAGEFGVSFSDSATGLDFDEGDTGIRVFGGWQFNSNFGIEAGYADGGTASETLGDITVDLIEADIDIDVKGFDLYFTGTLPMGEMFYAYGKLGGVFWDADAKLTIREDDGEGGVITTTDSFSDSGQDFAYGAGLGMNIGEYAGLQLEYVKFDVSDGDADFLSANFVWRFR